MHADLPVRSGRAGSPADGRLAGHSSPCCSHRLRATAITATLLVGRPMRFASTRRTRHSNDFRNSPPTWHLFHPRCFRTMGILMRNNGSFCCTTHHQKLKQSFRNFVSILVLWRRERASRPSLAWSIMKRFSAFSLLGLLRTDATRRYWNNMRYRLPIFCTRANDNGQRCSNAIERRHDVSIAIFCDSGPILAWKPHR